MLKNREKYQSKAMQLDMLVLSWTNSSSLNMKLRVMSSIPLNRILYMDINMKENNRYKICKLNTLKKAKLHLEECLFKNWALSI